MSLRARRRLRSLIIPPLGALLLAWGCAKQGEGERCDAAGSNDEDCESGLVCVRSDDLLEGETDRCCPPEGAPISDNRCIRSIGGIGGAGGQAGSAGQAGTAGVAGTAGTAGSAGTAGQGGQAGSDGGTTCMYSSQCPGTLICGPTGVCQPECLGPKDCPSPLVCNMATMTCEAPTLDASAGG